jgi:hypothetical protein
MKIQGSRGGENGDADVSVKPSAVSETLICAHVSTRSHGEQHIIS